MSFGKIIVTVGMITLFHAAYSAAQHRSYLRMTEQEFTNLPMDILIQTLFALVLTCCGVCKVVGSFREIRAVADLENRTWDSMNSRTSFYVFNHRGKKLFSEE
ncbi:hypothetical protein HELRODRAFT_88075 [Helobdella robusta]|uniref:Membrane magnesium transporter n=1 Tax=Helobdella robusta TaxID=6412 RepID=T1G6Y2_HELRO|nr:hypothetical protein HELRODRAFT_88075 [Helobdella robusta]ESN93880.1 hypothetical protein HELRODRAFT_88075 [Helobdella robusta]